MESPTSNDGNAAHEGGVNIDLQFATPTHSHVHPDRVTNLPTDTDMMDASDSMPETSQYWLDGTSDIDPANSAKKSKKAPASKAKGKRAAVEVADGEEGDVETPPAPKSATKTPSKKGISKPGTPKTPASKMSAKRKAQVIDNDGSDDDDTPTRKGGDASNLSGRIRKPPKNGIAESNIIPNCYEECNEADRMLVDMRKNEQYTWPQVRDAWFQLTGKKVGTSTLPNRLDRLRLNFSVIKEEDRKFLLKAKLEIEKNWEKEKWERIAIKVQELGGDFYGDEHLKRQWKVMMQNEGIAPPPGLNVADWRNDKEERERKEMEKKRDR